MNGEDKISVLMPTYNDAKYISNAIESLLNQSYKNLELIVIAPLLASSFPEV